MAEQLFGTILHPRGQGTAEDPIDLENELAVTLPSPELKPFRLLDLPPELWIRIGKFAIDVYPRVASRFARSSRGYSPSRRHFPLQPGITRVCTMLRAELLPYYYRTRIRLEVSHHVVEVGRWLRHIGPANRKLLRVLWLSQNYNRGEGAMEQRLRDVWKVEFEIEGLASLRGEKQGSLRKIRLS